MGVYILGVMEDGERGDGREERGEDCSVGARERDRFRKGMRF